MARLKKSDVERLTRDFDQDPVAALTTALRRTTGSDATEWNDLVAELPIREPQRQRLLTRDARAMDELLRDLIELREVPAPGSGMPTA